MERILLNDKVPITQTSRAAGMRLMRLVWRYKVPVIVGMLCALLATLLFSAAPLFIKYIIDAISKKDLSRVNMIVSLIVIAFLVRWVVAYYNNYLVTYAGMKLVELLRNDSYRKLQLMSFGFYEKRRAGELMSRLSNDTSVVQMFVTSGINEMVRVPIGIISALAVVIYLSAKLTIIAIVLLPVIVFIIAVGGRKMKNVSLMLQERIAGFNAVIYEVLGLIHIVKMFSMEQYEIDRFTQENTDVVNMTMKQVSVRSFYTPMVDFMGACCLALIFWIGAHDIVNGTHDFITGKMLTLGDLTGLFIGLQQMYTNVNHVNTINLTMQHAFAAAERTFEIIDMEPDIQDAEDAVEMEEVTGRVEFEDISFSYNPGEPVIQGVSLTAEPGKVVAIVGSSGSGKSTLVKLLPRFYDVNAGSIRIDGVDIRNAKMESYRKHIGFVPQETMLFMATIRENIEYGSIGASDAAIIEAAEAAYAHDFIMEMPQGYDTLVGERGVTLSGGQRQRIAIARAVLMNPKILILDEATSNVDNVSEVYIQQALDKLMKDRTTFVIAHRLTTVRNADLILVLEYGKIIEQGRHEDLYNKGGTYRRLYDLTLTTESVPPGDSGEKT